MLSSIAPLIVQPPIVPDCAVKTPLFTENVPALAVMFPVNVPLAALKAPLNVPLPLIVNTQIDILSAIKLYVAQPFELH